MKVFGRRLLYSISQRSTLTSLKPHPDTLRERSIAEPDGSQQIATFPLSGRVVPKFSTEQIREVIESSYRIIYYIKLEQIDVLAVLHGSQQITPPEDPSE